MTYVIAGLGLLAGLFYGLWQRSRAKRAEADLREARNAWQRLNAEKRAEVARYERLVASLKTDIKRMEEQSFANATPEQLRARLDALLRPHT